MANRESSDPKRKRKVANDPAPTCFLSRIFVEHKGYVSDKWEHYLPIYETALSRLIARGKPLRLLEIGVQNGGSLQIWSKYLPRGSTIVAIDVDPACAELSFGANVSILIGDASDPATLDGLLADACFDVIIDDGSHRSEHVIATFEACFARLAAGGLYIIEDLHASYMGSLGGGFRRAGASMEWLKELLDALNADHYEADASEALEKSGLQRLRDRGREIACVTFFDSLVLVQKLPREKRTPYRRIMTGRDARVINLADQVVSAMPASQMRALLMPLSTVEAFAPTLLTAMAELKTKLSQSNHLREQAEAAARHLNSAREQNVQELRAQVAERDQSVHDLRALVATREQNVRDLQTRIAASEQNVRDLNAQVAERDQNVCELQAQIAQRDQNIRNLQAQLYHLQTRSAFPKFEDLSSL